MPQPIPARIGDPLDMIDTPALVLDLDAFDANLARMADLARRAGVALRPHAKSHKCAQIARRQIAAGAVGVCVQKISEAAALAAEGIDDILVCNELITPQKIGRLIELNRTGRVAACVDDPGNIDRIAAMAGAAGVTVPLLVEVDVGQGRCGAAPGAPIVALAARIVAAPALRFAGLHAYHGGAQHLRDVDERQAAARAAIGRAGDSVAALKAAGIACPVVSGAGTGTFAEEAASGVYTEIQPGSYLFMDADYNRNRWAGPPFRQSLFVLAGVLSRRLADTGTGTGTGSDRGPGQAIVDAGLKAIAFDSGPPEIAAVRGQDPAGLEYTRPSDEHGTIRVADGVPVPPLGSPLWLVPGHCDPTVNLYDWIVAVRGDRVEALWPVTARGCLG